MTELAARAPEARIEPDRPVSIGEELWLAIASDKLHLFDPDTENAIA